MAPVSKLLGVCIAMAGVAMLVGGIVALAHCDQTGPSFFGGTICLRNDWSGVGVALVLVGLVVLILGLVLPYATAPAPPPQPVTYAQVPVMPGYVMGYGAYAPAYPAYGPPAAYGQPTAYGQPAAPAPPASAAAPAVANPPRTCTKCGAPVTSQFCASCGAQQW